jgi:hypothetical protein
MGIASKIVKGGLEAVAKKARRAEDLERKAAEAYAQMPEYLQDPYLGLSTSNIGKVTKADKAPKRLPRLNYGEEVIFNGPQIKYGGKVLAKKGDLISIDTQRVNGICIAKFIHYGKKVGKTYPDYYSITAKIDRTLLQTTKERDIKRINSPDGGYFIERGINLIK